MRMTRTPRRAAGRGIALLLVLTASVLGQETSRYHVADEVRNGLLGFSVSFRDGLAFAGAPAPQNSPGHGYLFNPTNNATLDRLQPADQPSDGFFGFTSKLSSDWLVVGDPGNPNQSGTPAGKVYVIDPGTGNELRTLQPDNSFAGDEFGFGVALSGDTAIIGSPHLGVGEGAAFLFDVSNGQQLLRLLPNDPSAGSDFGNDVALSRTFAMVGARVNFMDEVGELPGSAYVFDLMGNQLHKLRPKESFGGDEFGWDMAIDGNLAVIGAPNGGGDVGSAYLFNLTTGEQLFRFTDNRVGGNFGVSVDIHNNVVAVAADGLGRRRGAVSLYDAKTGMLLDTVLGSDVAVADAFGTSVALHGTQMLVGVPLDDSVDLNEGSVYLFDLNPDWFSVSGDFNENGLLDVNDIDQLTQAVASGGDLAKFDITGDGALNAADRELWIDVLFGSFFGDANLDYEFNSDDLLTAFAAGEYEDQIPNNSTWEEGDWDGDFDFTTDDLIAGLVTGAYANGPRTAISAVPEPTSGLLLVVALLGCLTMRGRRVGAGK